jgi:SH3 domain protein
MTRNPIIFAALLALPLAAGAAADQQYISDEIALSIRDQPSNNGAVIGVAHSGDPVTVIQTLGEQSFAKVRTADGTVGWVTARYLSDHPAAKDQLAQTRKALDAARAQIQSLQQSLDSNKQKLSELKPAQELAADNKNLRSELELKEHEGEALQRRYNEEQSRRQTLLAGGALVAAGIILGLLLPWLGRRKRRRYSDF